MIVQLSATLHDSGAPEDISRVCNVHGVRDSFLDIGRKVGGVSARDVYGAGAGEGVGVAQIEAQKEAQMEAQMEWRPEFYFLGKKLWSKGYRELLSLLDSPEARKAQADGSMPTLHFHGSGPDETAIVAEAKRTGVDVSHFPAIDHANDALREYPVFVNPSTSDVLCTATAEAVAMGKMVLIIEVGPLDAEL